MNFWGKTRKDDLRIAEEDGRRAWRILIVNHLLARDYKRRKRYIWTPDELAQLSGVDPRQLSIGRSPKDIE